MWTYGNELYHYGRLGMKWGRHKYTTKYGALNRSGRRRTDDLADEYDVLSKVGRLSKKGMRRKAAIEKEYENLTGKHVSEHVRKPKPVVKSINDMTNEELIAYNTRKQLEKTYLSYQPQPEPSRKSIGMKFAKGVFDKFIIPEATAAGKKFVANKIGELTMSDAAKAERAFDKSFEKLKKQTEHNAKVEAIRKMKLDNDSREYEAKARARAAAGTSVS